MDLFWQIDKLRLSELKSHLFCLKFEVTIVCMIKKSPNLAVFWIGESLLILLLGTV